MTGPGAVTGDPEPRVEGIDPITLEVQWQRLVTIVDEMDTATIRTSFSSIVGESHDFGCVLMDQDAAGLAQAQWSPPQFCTMMPITTRHMLRRFPKETLRPGDVLITNDPWIGSTHLPDYNLVSPVFHRGRLVAFFGTVAHVSDVGGHRGDLEAVDLFQEGTRVLPTFFYREGEPVEVVHEFIAANCRVPDLVMGDLNAIVGTHCVAGRRLEEFLDDYDLEDLRALSREILTRSETALRQAIAALPDGITRYEVTGDGYLEPFTLKVCIEIRGSDMFFDFAGSSPQVRDAAINAAFNLTYATTVYPIKCMLAPRIPNNDGLVRPLHVTAPEGSIVNCTFPAPVKARAKVMKHIPPLIFGALAPLLPDEVIAAAGGIFPFYFSGEDPRYGTFSVHVLPHGGTGATRRADGWLPVAYPHNSTITPAEIMELQCPVLMVRKAILPDTGGPGRRRGGPGQEFVLKSVAAQPITLTIRPDLIRFPAPGLFGGHPGALGEVWLNGERVERFPPLEFRPGDVCVIRVPGGGGYGPPREREPDRVRRDVALGYVSRRAAREVYGVEVEEA
ncbi:MAG: hydantoinase B/oxoprolinase family protein [Armatimonadota bacterium]|nr:hydantoinase B/oxoprolinase family protein [Armatimonadota bacterium]MDR7488514.1 hydantoinase B/oxoprolinase family protein [Armatimonadota bacterium]MDR7573795.1 hydantoinase B/oxoprolinase family protein [Armatimonadota bacterium]